MKKHLSPLAKLIILGSILLLSFTAFRGLFFPDEGYILNTGARILSGQVLYRDFDFVYTPLTAFATSLSFLILGKSILTERILALIIGLLTTFVLYRLGKQLAKQPLLQLIPALVYIAWGPTHINFVWPGMWAVDFGIIATVLLFEGIKKTNTRLLFVSGITFALVILTKQNFAAAVLIELAIGFLLIKQLRSRQLLIPLLGGLVAPLFVTFFYLLLTHSFSEFLISSYVNVFQLILIQGSINTPLIAGSNIFKEIIKLVFYFSPLLISTLSAILWWKKEKLYVFLSLFVAIFYLFGFRPVTDYVHLSPLLSLTGIPLLLLFMYFKRYTSFPRLILYTLYFILFSIGVWSSLFFGYYRWNPPLLSQNEFVNNSRVLIWTDKETKNKIETVTNLLDKYSRPQEAVFLNYYAPMIYFISDRKNPTRYDYTGLTKDYQNNLVQTLLCSNVSTILTFYLNKDDPSAIGKYMRANYKKVAIEKEYEVWKRK